MKRQLLQLAILGSLGLIGNPVSAVICVDETCQRPGFPASNNNTPPTGWAANTTSVVGLRAIVSSGTVGNVSGSRYYFAATTSNFGDVAGKTQIVNDGNGFTQIGAFLTNATSNPGDAVNGGQITALRGGTAFYFYAQACPSGANSNSGLCSEWTRIRTNTFSTNNYPTTVFSQPPFLGTDSTVNSIRVRTNIPSGDPVSQLQLDVFDVDNSLNDNMSIPYIGNVNYDITNADFSPGFRPNTQYRYVGQAIYEYGQQVPQSEPQPVQFLYTRPVDPVPGNITEVTHCSALLAFQNSSGLPANPSVSQYQVCLNNGAGCSQTAIGGNLPASANSIRFTNLNFGTSYQADVKVLNRGGSPWQPSNTVNYPGNPDFTTLDWGGNSSVTGITTNSANYNITSLDTTGVVSYQVMLNGVSQGVIAGLPPATIPLSGLTPNTQYTVGLRLSESNCTSPTVLQQSFTTTPNVPQTFDLTAPTPTSLNATWAANGNPGGTTYQVQYCLDAAFTLDCRTATSGAGATSLTLTAGVNPATQYFAHVRAMTVGGGLNSAYSNADNATTPPDIRSITISPSTATVLTSGTRVFSATVRDDVGNVIPGQAVVWSVSGGGSVSPSNGASTTFTAGAAAGGPFTLTASLLPNWPDATATIIVDASGISFTGPSFTVNPNGVTGTATVDAIYNGVPDPSLTYTWSVLSGPTSNVQFSPNGTTASKNTNLTFTRAGTYTLQVLVTKPSNGDNNSASTSQGVVTQILTGLRVSPDNVTIKKGQTQDFSASGADQFGDGMAISGVTWSSNVSAAGTNASFTAAALGQSIQVTATSGGRTGFATVNVLDFDVSNAKAYPVPYKSTQHTKITFGNLGSSAKIRIFTITGKKVFEVDSTSPTYDWDVKNSAGEKLASGVYFFRIESPDAKKEGKIVIIQ